MSLEEIAGEFGGEVAVDLKGGSAVSYHLEETSEASP